MDTFIIYWVSVVKLIIVAEDVLAVCNYVWDSRYTARLHQVKRCQTHLYNHHAHSLLGLLHLCTLYVLLCEE
jgi:hypothetical protein